MIGDYVRVCCICRIHDRIQGNTELAEYVEYTEHTDDEDGATKNIFRLIAPVYTGHYSKLMDKECFLAT